MILPKFEYAAPKSLKEANRFIEEIGEEAKLMAGGTDVIVAMKEKQLSPKYIIDLKDIAALDYLEYDPTSGLKIGALTKLRTIEHSSLVKQKFPAVAKAAGYVASTQVRAKATMAGNICNASPSADTAPILIVLDAVVTAESNQGKREIKMEDFFAGAKKTTLEKNEIVTEIRIPNMEQGQSSAYIKHAVRKAMDLAIVGVAVSLTLKENRCTAVKIALGAVAATPIRAVKAEGLLQGKVITEELLEEAAQTAAKECTPISDVRASAEYRQDMVRVFTKRAIQEALNINKKREGEE